MSRPLAVLALSLFLGCADGDGPNPDLGPVDGPYTVRLTASHGVCLVRNPEEHPALSDVVQDFPDTTVQLDAFLRPDGLLDLRHSSSLLPKSLDGGVIEGVARLGAEVDFHEESVSVAGSELSVSALGQITPEALSLDFTETFKDDNNDCTYTVHAEGRRRPLADPDALDGYYTAHYDVWWKTCADTTEVPPTDSHIARVDVVEHDDGTVTVNLGNGGVVFTAKAPGPDHQLRFKDGEMLVLGTDAIGNRSLISRQGTATGRLAADGMDLTVSYEGTEAEKGCATTALITGEKMLPSRAGTQNDYRMQYDLSGNCVGDPLTRRGTATLTELGHGKYRLDDLNGSTEVTVKDGVVSGIQGDVTHGGYEAKVDGRVDPPLLSYTVTIVQLDFLAGSICTAAIEATGEVRYVFE